MISLKEHLVAPIRIDIGGAPEGSDALAIAEFLSESPTRDVLYIARDESRMLAMEDALRFFSPNEKFLRFPAWDCLPYDRVSPKKEVISRRLRTLIALSDSSTSMDRKVLLTTCNAAIQRVSGALMSDTAYFQLEVASSVKMNEFRDYLNRNGYVRTGTVMEPGEYAIRGGIVDLYPSDFDFPVRIDFFGDTIDSIRDFDPLTQRSTDKREVVELIPGSEVLLDEKSIARFRTQYRNLFGAITGNDPLYDSVSEGRRYPGMEHWLPLFQGDLRKIFDYLPNATIFFDHLLEQALEERIAHISDFYSARLEALGTSSSIDAPVYRPVPVDQLFLSKEQWQREISSRAVGAFSVFDTPSSARPSVNLGARYGRDFSPERKRKDTDLFSEVRAHIKDHISRGRKVIVTCHSEGALDRLTRLLGEFDIDIAGRSRTWKEVLGVSSTSVSLIVLPVQEGFETTEYTVLSEQDILGDRLATRVNRARRAKNFLTETTNLSVGDIVVHVDHGVGKFEGLETIQVSSAPHDCVKLTYYGGDRLYLPVENIEMLGRYGAGDSEVRLDNLSSASWQIRKSKVKKQLRDMAEELIATAAERTLKVSEAFVVPDGPYDEFCARFPFIETEDQLHGIDDCISDLTGEVPMDRLVCGDVGFGKTEVALRAAFVAASAGKQVAIVTPTTLLSRQHFQTFEERFKGFQFSIGQLSRLVSSKAARDVREAVANGDIDIIVGTHALLSKSVTFKDLGLLVIDEEQHFGVAQKERLKAIKSDVDVLTLTATPIPRTLQLALSGVRQLSIIATPPVDRLAIRSFIMPYDRVVIREAIMREHFRGGQVFYVCPRIRDIDDVATELRAIVPEIKFIIAHGRMAPSQLDSAMNAFYDGQYDLLLSTSIIDSGLDIPSANTLVVHRADRFGLAQLYQLRGRVGRSKTRAYAYFTVAGKDLLKGEALKRLEVLHKLDSLGAGFSLSSYDLDIRGAGNLLGEEQSGHIREIGIELYQQLLNEAVLEARGPSNSDVENQQWSPQIQIGVAVLLPGDYVPDLSVRLALYRRLAAIEEADEIDGFAAELIDRFGPLPESAEYLLRVVRIKQLCRRASIDQIDAGHKGAVLGFRDNVFAAPEELIKLISESNGKLRVRPDQKLVFSEEWPTAETRFVGLTNLVGKMISLISTNSGDPFDASD